MEDKEKNETESSSSSNNSMSKASRRIYDDASEQTSVVAEEELESESLQNSLVNTIATIQNNFFKKGRTLETWHQFMLNKILYNKDYIYMDETFCFIERKTMVRREQVTIFLRY